MHAICRFSLTLLSRNTGDVTWATTQKNCTCKNELSYSTGAFAQYDRDYLFFLHSRKVFLPSQTVWALNRLHSDWRVNNVQNDTNRFCLDVARYPWTQVHVYKVIRSKSSYTPSCKTGISYTSESGRKPCQVCKNFLSAPHTHVRFLIIDEDKLMVERKNITACKNKLSNFLPM